MNSNNQKRVIAGILLLSLAASGLFFSYRFTRLRTYFLSEEQRINEKRQPWMTVFIHGTFATVIGMLNMFQVMQDDIENTDYKKITGRMRRDPFFYQMQPLHEKGIVRIEPTFNCEEAPGRDGAKYAVHPITQAYCDLQEAVAPTEENNLFYTFGWSGLISQQRRRKEAVRLYNSLQDELKNLAEQNIYPKVRIITHSHGGNLVLNMAGVHELVTRDYTKKISKRSHPDEDHRGSLIELQSLLQKLPKKDDITAHHSIKKWDYLPLSPDLKVDELILLGTPVQPETLPFFNADIFGKIFHFYSDDDMVQKMDWVSTKRYYSEQRVPTNKITSGDIVQARLMVNRDMTPLKKDDKEYKPEQKSWLESLFAGSKPKVDPMHKELWFMSWKGKEKMSAAQEFLKPLPFVILTPFYRKIIEQARRDHDKTLTDVSLNIRFNGDQSEIGLYRNGDRERKKICRLALPLERINSMREAALMWTPDHFTPNTEMEMLQKYSTILKE